MADEYSDEISGNYRLNRQMERKVPLKDKRDALVQERGWVEPPRHLRDIQQTPGNKALLDFFSGSEDNPAHTHLSVQSFG